MQPEEIEDLLFHRAVHSKIHAPAAQRASNLSYNRTVTGGVVAGAALVCSFAVSNTAAPSVGDRGYVAVPPEHMEAATAGLAMSHVGH